MLDEMKELSKQRYVTPYFMAPIYASLGEKDQAFEWLEKAYQDRHGWLITPQLDPTLEGLRSDPRFADLLKRIGLAA